MDKFNVISPTNNLDDLEKDYNNWCLLPHDMRMRANDECMRTNGCTVPDLYNKYKDAIIGIDDLKEILDDSSNIIKEDGLTLDSIIHSDKFAEQKLLSAQFKNNPFIIIIDPDTYNIDELEKQYDSYLYLSSRNKSLSNEYSFSIWGYNVINMYQLIKDKLTTPNQDQSINVKLYENARPEDSIDSIKDVVNSAFIYNKIFEKYAYTYCKYNTVYENAIYNEMLHSIEESTKFSIDILPTVLPWFTPAEMIEKNINFNYNNKNYYKALKEADGNKEKLLELGWNPNIDKYDSDVFSYVKHRQFKYINNFIESIDVSNVNIFDDIESTNKELKPVYFVFDTSEKVAISFSNKLSIMYEFNGINDKFIGFNKVYIDNNSYTNIKAICIFLKQDVYKDLIYKCEKFDKFSEIQGFGSVYSLLTNTKNKFDPNSDKIVYANYIEMLLKILCIDIDKNEIDYDKFNYSHENSLRVYILYNGPINNYDPNRIADIMNLIIDENNIKATLENNYYIDKRDASNIYINILAEVIII